MPSSGRDNRKGTGSILGVQTKGNLMRHIDVTDESLSDFVIDPIFLAFEANLEGIK